MWLVLLSFHLIGFVGYNLLLRKSITEKIDRFTLATIMQTGITIPLLFTLFYKVPALNRYDLKTTLLVIGLTGFTILLHVTNTMALNYLEAGVYSVLYNLRILFATVLGIVFLGEKTDLIRILGGLLILVAIVIVRQKGSKVLLEKGFSWGLSAAVTISFLNLFEKSTIDRIGYLGYAAPAMLSAMLIMWGYLFYRDRKINFKIFLQPQIIRLMIFRDMSAFGFTLALVYGGLISVSNYISSMGVIFLVALGAIFLGERDYLRQKIFATIVAVAGVTIVLLTSL